MVVGADAGVMSLMLNFFTETLEQLRVHALKLKEYKSYRTALRGRLQRDERCLYSCNLLSMCSDSSQDHIFLSFSRAPTENTKAGRCPASIMGGLCSTQCTTDKDCGTQNEYKCCAHR